MVLYLIGLGLCSEKDITVRGLECVKSSDFVYMEHYTSILCSDISKLEEFYGKKLILADRETIESRFEEEILEKAKKGIVSVLVVGDPLSATTHFDLYMRCVKENVKIEVINNASIMNSIGITGLSLYRFGETVSIPFFTKKWRPYSFFEKICRNYNNNLHTLVLLDIRVKEISDENLAKGKKIYEKPRFMTTKEALSELLEASENSEEYKGLINNYSLCFCVARIGSPTQKIIAGTIGELINEDLGSPLHSIIICSKELISVEKEAIEFYRKK